MLVADRRSLVRAGIGAILEREGFFICAEAGTRADALRAAVRHRPQLCVLEVELPGGGIAAARRISRDLPGTRVLMVTESTEPRDVVGALRAGARGYLLKESGLKRLGVVGRAVLRGEFAVPRRFTSTLVDELREGPGGHLVGLAPQLRSLTRRERQIVELLVDDRPSAEIAVSLGISEVTVRRHISAIVAKLGVTDRHAVASLIDGARPRGAIS